MSRRKTRKSNFAEFDNIDLTDRENVRPVFLSAAEALHILAFCERELGTESDIAEAFGGELPRTFHDDESKTLCRQIVSAIYEAAIMATGSLIGAFIGNTIDRARR